MRKNTLSNATIRLVFLVDRVGIPVFTLTLLPVMFWFFDMVEEAMKPSIQPCPVYW